MSNQYLFNTPELDLDQITERIAQFDQYFVTNQIIIYDDDKHDDGFVITSRDDTTLEVLSAQRTNIQKELISKSTVNQLRISVHILLYL